MGDSMNRQMNGFLTMAEIFQDYMTLQRNKEIKLWGTAASSQRLTVLLDCREIYVGEISQGKFELTLPPQEAAENQTLRIRNHEGKEIVICNVDIGEVWLAGGQSNMEFPLLCDRKGDQVIAAAKDEHLRYYEVGKYAFEGEREEKLKDDHRWNHWRRFISGECTHFSAVATYYAMRLREQLRIPIAIVGCCWGGTSASAWMRESVLRSDEKLRIYTDAYAEAIAGLDFARYSRADYKKRAFMGKEKNAIGAERTMKQEVSAPLKFPTRQLIKLMLLRSRTGPHDCNRPGGLYQTMLSKIIGFAIRGVIWYQGESDEHHADLYGHLFSELISCWRNDWQDDLPFLFVQLAPWDEWMAQDGRNFPELRRQQQYVEDHVDGTYMASIMDAGSRFDIHPKEKEPVGQRLALLALDKIYGIRQAYAQAPRIVKVERKGAEITVIFAYAERGLSVKGRAETLFCVMQKGQRVPVTGSVEENRVLLHCSGLMEEKAVLCFAHSPFLVMNLFNQGGLPARPTAPQEI